MQRSTIPLSDETPRELDEMGPAPGESPAGLRVV